MKDSGKVREIFYKRFREGHESIHEVSWNVCLKSQESLGKCSLKETGKNRYLFNEI